MRFFLFFSNCLNIIYGNYSSVGTLSQKNPLSNLFEKILDMDTVEEREEGELPPLDTKEESGFYLLLIHGVYIILGMFSFLFQKIIFIYLLLSLFLSGINTIYYGKVLGYVAFFFLGLLQMLLMFVYLGTQIFSGNMIVTLFIGFNFLQALILFYFLFQKWKEKTIS